MKPRLATSGSSQQFGRGASLTPRTKILTWSARIWSRFAIQKSADDQKPTYWAVFEPSRPVNGAEQLLHISIVEPSTPQKAP